MSNLLPEIINLNGEIYNALPSSAIRDLIDVLPDSVIRDLVDMARSKSSSIPKTKSYDGSTRSKDLRLIEFLKTGCCFPDIDWEDPSVSDEDKINQSISFAKENGYGVGKGTLYCPWPVQRICDATGKSYNCIYQRIYEARNQLEKEMNSYVTQ
jgi:hypothetical protein